ncbi:MAG: carboxypeptidase regulatory-like domain-containing protein [Planctomycetes bacterium]|nr:carboxypeptidase regulatory-like domain-containing protein [Planctomycetota bacterium]
MKLDRLHVALLVVAAAGLAFGVYGMTRPDGVAPPRVATTGEPARTAPAPDTPPERADTRPNGRATPGPSNREPGGENGSPEHAATVDPSPDTPQARPELRGDGVLEGMVLDAGGNPVPGARIGAAPQLPHSRGRTVSLNGASLDEATLRLIAEARRNTWHTTSDEAGRFAFRELARDHLYFVTAHHDLWGALRKTDCSAGETLILQYGVAALTLGEAVDPQGHPVPGLRVTRSWGEAFHDSGEASPQPGRFVMRWEAGHVRFRIEAPGFVPSEPLGVETRGRRDLRVVLRVAPRLTGQVVSPSGSPVPKATVLALPAAGAENGPDDPIEVRCDVSGRFILHSLAPGEYQVKARAGALDSEPVSVKLESESDSDIKLVLDAGPALTVRVLNPEGKPVGNVWVTLQDAAGEHLHALSQETGVPGETLHLGLPRAVVEVRIDMHSDAYAPQWHEVDLTTGPQRLEVTLAPGCVVTGRVTDSSGRGLADVYLRLTPPGGGEKGRYLVTYTRKDGAFTTQPLSRGAWAFEVFLDPQSRCEASEVVQITGTGLRHDIRVAGLCTLKVTVKGFPAGRNEWMTLWYSRGDGEPPSESFMDKPEHTLTLPEGTYLMAVSCGRLGSRLVEVTVAAGRLNEVTLTLVEANALRFGWVDQGSGDILIEYDARPVANRAELNAMVEANRGKTTVPVVVLRGTTRVELTIPAATLMANLEPAVR